MIQEEPSISNMGVIASNESTRDDSSYLPDQSRKESCDTVKRDDKESFLYLVDIIEKIPTTDLTLVSLNSYFKLTKQNIRWADTANLIISQLSNYCSTPMLTLRISVDTMYLNTPKLFKNLKLLGINSLFELDDILRGATFWGNDAIKKLFIEEFERVLHKMSIGTLDYYFEPCDIITFIVLLARSHLIKENPALLDAISLPFDKKYILNVI